MVIISALLNVWSNVWPYLVAIALFLILIVIHEFGHFIAAKLLGVRVNEFAVGFGPKLFSKQGKETKYSVNLVPLGGYCAMEGEDEDSGDERAFCNKKPWRRFIIVAMGATFNLILGLIIVAVTLAPQKAFNSTVVAEFKENAVSEQSGLKADDVKFDSSEENGISYLNVDFYVYGIRKTLGSYIKQTFATAASYCAVVWRSLIDLISGKYGISAVSGPVGVTAAIGSAAKQSLENLLPIMALITINLGIFNLLPIPALDGGRLLFILIEMIFRKPVPQKYEAIVHAVGFALLIGFMLLITAKDIWTLIAG